ncbi:hypothetical protein [Stenotrophomonas maltophilia]|uniref:hypothetical protein n=1 Tax=Stenotrophomonas maltophilia TaxID=40324 RepID=UPI0011B559F7|nr:hypothetical protein [Stenotrophomonas maltophilia]
MDHCPPPMPSAEAFELALSLLGQDGISLEQAEQAMLEAGVEYGSMRRLLVWLPEAFGLALVGHMEGVALPGTFTARDADAQEHTFAFDCEPLFAPAVRRALQVYHEGPRAQFKAVAQRSSTMDAVNTALFAEVDLRGATLSGPQLLDIPAETYLRGTDTTQVG